MGVCVCVDDVIFSEAARRRRQAEAARLTRSLGLGLGT